MKRSSSFLAAAAVALSAAAVPALAATTVNTAKNDKYGAYLTDGQGRAVYLFKADKRGKGKTPGVSNCYDACAKAWPPLMADAGVDAAGQAKQALVGTIDRKGGGKQVTYAGWPLYYFVKDAGPGSTTGQDVEGFGAEWYLVTPEGKEVHGRK